MHDVFATNTYSGSDAIDHIWTTKYLLDDIAFARMVPFDTVYESDHCKMFLDIANSILLDQDEIKIMYHDFRRLKTGAPKREKKNREYVTKS